MKSKDLLVVGGLGLLAYMLISKPKAEGAVGTITKFIPMPAAAAGAPVDIGGLFSGIASIFGAMPQQIIPEINIPEFQFPDLDKFIPEMPDWERFIPDWEGLIPAWDELMPDWDKLIPKGDGGNGKTIIETIIDTVTGNGGNGGDGFTIKVPGVDIIPPEITIGGEGITEAIGGFLGSIVNAPANILNEIAETTHWPWRIRMGDEPVFAAPTKYRVSAEQEWQAKGYPEEITPEWYYEQKRLNSGLLPHQIAAMRADTEVEATTKYPEYEADMQLLAESAPYLLTEAELERYG